MKYLRALLILVFAGLLFWVVSFARAEFKVVAGYSAKQLCSGVFVAGLPEQFVARSDIYPRLEFLGQFRRLLSLRVEPPAGLASASFLGVQARAVHHPPRGCILDGGLPGEPAPVLPSATPPRSVPAALEPALAAAFEEPEGGGRNTLAVLISYRGVVIAERYREPVGPQTPMQGWSMNKSLMATWVGMQAAAGALDPTRPIVELDPSLPRRTLQEPGVDERLTLLHLLQMESGIAVEESYGVASDVTRMLYRTPRMRDVAIFAEQASAPGVRFYYSSADTVLASHVWQQSLEQPYAEWLETRFRAPLGLQTLVAESDISGVQVGSSYAYLPARDWAKVGGLWLDAWHGRSGLLPQGWMTSSVQPRASDRRGRYGRGFWLNTAGVNFPALPESLFYASGNAGQYLVVVPEWELVVVRLGLTSPKARSGVQQLLRDLAALHRSGSLDDIHAEMAREAG